MRKALLVAGLFFHSAGAAESPSSVPVYLQGDTVTNDVVTPVPLIVIDAERTEKIRTQEARRIPAFVRYFPARAGLVESNFHQAFATNRDNFLEALEAAYDKPMLDIDLVLRPRFHRFVSLAQRQARPFPLSTNLAELWALGGQAKLLEDQLAETLRSAMTNYIRPDQIPPEARIGPWQWRLISGALTNTPSDFDAILKQALSVARTNVYTITRVKKELTTNLPPELQPFAKYLAEFVRANCVVDSALTAQMRTSKTNVLWAADHYEAGQLVVKTGSLIDGRAKAALDQLREKLAVDQVQEQAIQQSSKAAAALALATEQSSNAVAALALVDSKAAAVQRRLILGALLGLGVIVVVVLASFTITLWISRKSSSAGVVTHTSHSALSFTRGHLPNHGLLPAQMNGNNLAHDDLLSVVALTETESWRERALAAERRSSKLTHAIRIRLVPHLARWLAHKLVSQLISNRKQLLALQEQAEAEITALECRLEQISAPFQARVRAYEERIAQLERQLAARDEQNGELIRMTIESARRKLKLEEAKCGPQAELAQWAQGSGWKRKTSADQDGHKLLGRGENKLPDGNGDSSVSI